VIGREVGLPLLQAEMWDKALSYCRQAGEKALARSAYPEVVAAFEQVLGALQHLPESCAMCELAIDLRLAMDEALWRLGEWGRVLASLREAEALAHPFSLAVAAFGVGRLSLHQGDLSQAIAVCQRSLAVCQTHDLRDWIPDLAASVGYAYALAGRLPEALTLIEQAIGQCEVRRGGALEAAFVIWLGEVAAQRQPPPGERAEAHYRQALTLAQELGMRPLQAHCHQGLGVLYAAAGQRAQAHAALSTAIALYRDMEMHFWLPQAEATLVRVSEHDR
jgi:tetratricopeptide (TPR) repeat protein